MAHANPYAPGQVETLEQARNELVKLADTVKQIIDNQKLVQRDDGCLMDCVVVPHTLSDEVVRMIGHFELVGAYAARPYQKGQVVTYQNRMYVCAAAHHGGAVMDMAQWRLLGKAGCNDLQKLMDNKLLWFKQNAILPYDSDTDYPVGTVTLKDGKFQKWDGIEWSDFIEPEDSQITTWSGRTQREKNAERVSVKDFGAKGDYITDDTASINACFAAIGIGDVVYFPRGVYSYTGSLSIPEGVKIVGDGAPNLQIAPLTDDDKRFLRPGYKHLLPGSSIIFKGAGTATKTMVRSDHFASFNYALKTHLNTPNDISNIGIIMDMDVFNSEGKLTTIDTDNRSDYDVGLLIDDSHHCYINNVCVFGYWKKAGFLVASYGRAEGVSDNPDYIKCIRSVFSGDYGVALLGHDTYPSSSGKGEGLSGTTFIGCDIHDRTHHSRSELTTNPSERGKGVIYIDGITFLNTKIAGHMFIGCGLRGTSISPIQLDGCDAFSMIGCTTEFTGAGQEFISVTPETRRVVLQGNRQLSQAINIRNLANKLTNGVLVCDEDSSGCSLITKNGKGIKYGASDQINNDPALQLSTDFSSFLNGWNMRYSVANSALQFNYNGANAVTIDSSGNIIPSGRVKKIIGSGSRENRTISAGVITLTGASSYVAVAGEGSTADDLTTINGGTIGDIIVLVAYSASQPITVKHNAGLIRLSGSTDFAINTVYTNLTLMFNGTQWIEISRAVLA